MSQHITTHTEAGVATTVAERYAITVADIKAATDAASEITVTGPDDKLGMKAAKRHRLNLRAMRVAVETRRKELKADALAYGRKVDEVAKELTGMITPTEESMRTLEDTAKRESERLAKLAADARAEQLAKWRDMLAKLGAEFAHYDLEKMGPEEFNTAYMEAAQLADERKAAAEAEAERQRAIQAEADAKAKLEAEAKAQRDAAELEARIQREAEAMAAEKIRQAEAEAAKAEAAAKRKADRAAKKLAAAPDVEKISALSLQMSTMDLPQFRDEMVAQLVRDIMDRAANALIDLAEQIGGEE